MSARWQMAREPRKGQSLIEYIFVIPIIFTLILYIFQVFIISNTSTIVQLASYSAARAYAVTRDEKAAEMAANQFMYELDYIGVIEPFSGDQAWTINIADDDEDDKGLGTGSTVTIDTNLALMNFSTIKTLFNAKTASNTTTYLPEFGNRDNSPYIPLKAATRIILE